MEPDQINSPSTKKRGIFSRIRKIPNHIKYQFRDSKKIRWLFITSFLLNIGLWAGLSFLFRPQEEPIFLHYNIFFGIDLIGPWWKIFYLPITGLVILLLNTGFSAASYKEDKALSFMVMIMTVVFHLLLFAGAFLTVQLN